MTKLYENIRILCKENKQSIRKLEFILDFPTNTISDWRKRLPSGERLLIVASYFDVSVDYLLGNTDFRLSHRKSYSNSSAKLLEASEQLKPDESETEFIIKIMKLIKEQSS